MSIVAALPAIFVKKMPTSADWAPLSTIAHWAIALPAEHCWNEFALCDVDPSHGLQPA